MFSKVDLHIHTQASNGSDSPQRILEQVLSSGIRAFSITDHDCIEGSEEIARSIPKGVLFLRGIEFSCLSPAGKCHILGYNCDPENEVFRNALRAGHALRQDKLRRRIDFLRDTFGIRLTSSEFDWLHAQKSPGKPHFGQILVRRGLSDNVSDAIQKYINPCKGGRDRIDSDMAIHAILASGGVPVWAHPLGGEGERRLTGEQFAAQFAVLMESGVCGLECWYSRYTSDEIAFLVSRAQEYGLLISGGSDYHGTNKQGISIGMLSCDGTIADTAHLTLLNTIPSTTLPH